MENKINLVELLKDCPKGMELECALYDNCTFDGIEDVGYNFILINTPSGRIRLSKEGCYIRHDENAKCVIFPKGKTTWEGFVPPCKFKDGDIISNGICICIYNGIDNGEHYGCYVGVGHRDFPDYFIKTPQNSYFTKENSRLANEEEKEKLFQAIKGNGYKWDSESKTLEKLIKPVFKIGDKISLKCDDFYWDIKTIEGDWYICTNGAKIHIGEQHHYELVRVEPKFKIGDKIVKNDGIRIFDVVLVNLEYYIIQGFGSVYEIPIKEQDNFRLIPNKFDINTLKTFDEVLVRLTNDCVWMPKLFSHYDPKAKYYPFVITEDIGYPQCIPYKGNEYLCRKTDDCNEFYKTW